LTSSHIFICEKPIFVKTVSELFFEKNQQKFPETGSGQYVLISGYAENFS